MDIYAGKMAFRKDIEASGLEYSLLPIGGKKYAKDVGIPVNPEQRSALIPGNEFQI